MAISCPNCSAELPDDAVFCDQCGTSLGGAVAPPPAAADENICPQCGASTIPGEAFCDSCGASLAEPEVAAVPEPAPELPAAPAAPAESGLAVCPACGAENLPGSAFCSNCGIAMAEVEEVEATPEPEPAVEEEAPSEEAPVDEPVAPAPTPGVGRRFVVRDTGAEISLPEDEGEYVIGRDDPVSGVFAEVDMNPYDGELHGVSRRHAKLTVQAGLVFLQDMDSTNFTFVNRQKLTPDAPAALSSGDEVRLGNLVMTYLE